MLRVSHGAVGECGAGLPGRLAVPRRCASTPVERVCFQIPPASESYQMTPQSRKAPKPVVVNTADNYGMDLNSDDSTDDESHPRKPIPAWATGECGRVDVCPEVLGFAPAPSKSRCRALPSSPRSLVS